MNQEYYALDRQNFIVATVLAENRGKAIEIIDALPDIYYQVANVVSANSEYARQNAKYPTGE